MRIPLNGPLSEDEIQDLAEFLDVLEPATMNIETLDGYFCALICGPVLFPPTKCLPEILGEDHSFGSEEEAVEIIGLLMRHWNTISGTLKQPRRRDSIYFPVLSETDDGVAMANDWAKGFMKGVQAIPGSWNELIESEKHGGLLRPITTLAHEHDPDPAQRPDPISHEKREELIQEIVGNIGEIYRYFAPHRKERARKSALM